MTATASNQTDFVPLSDEHKFTFELQGWVCIPGVLPPEQAAEMRDYITDVHSREDKPRAHVFTGPAQALLDHPVLIGALREFIMGVGGESAHPFRCEGGFSVVRSHGERDHQLPHRGPRIGAFTYGFRDGRIDSGLTRVVWELNEVGPDDHATGFFTGSHKMNLPIPDALRTIDSPLLSTYTCPPGSLILFSESTIHAGMVWRNADHPRVALLYAYSSACAQWHKLNLPRDIIEAMPEKRRTLFRGVWGHNFHAGQSNNYYDETNVSL